MGYFGSYFRLEAEALFLLWYRLNYFSVEHFVTGLYVR